MWLVILGAVAWASGGFAGDAVDAVNNESGLFGAANHVWPPQSGACHRTPNATGVWCGSISVRESLSLVLSLAGWLGSPALYLRALSLQLLPTTAAATFYYTLLPAQATWYIVVSYFSIGTPHSGGEPSLRNHNRQSSCMPPIYTRSSHTHTYASSVCDDLIL